MFLLNFFLVIIVEGSNKYLFLIKNRKNSIFGGFGAKFYRYIKLEYRRVSHEFLPGLQLEQLSFDVG